MDATTMEYSHEFDAVIDKGTLDALNCGDFEVVENLIMKMEYPLRSRHLRVGLPSLHRCPEGGRAHHHFATLRRGPNAGVSVECMDWAIV